MPHGGGEYEYYGQRNDKSAVEAGRVDQRKSNMRFLQRYVLGYERMREYLISTTNNIASQIIPRKYYFDFHCRRGEMCGTSPACLDRPIGRYFVA
jgi:hypothetical protein